MDISPVISFSQRYIYIYIYIRVVFLIVIELGFRQRNFQKIISHCRFNIIYYRFFHQIHQDLKFHMMYTCCYFFSIFWCWIYEKPKKVNFSRILKISCFRSKKHFFWKIFFISFQVYVFPTNVGYSFRLTYRRHQ